MIKDKLNEYSLSDLIHFRYTMNSKEDPEGYQLITTEIKKRKQSISYYGYRQFINDGNFITRIKKTKIFEDVINIWKETPFKGIVKIVTAPFLLMFSLTKLFLFTIYNYYADSKYEQSAYFSSLLALMCIIFLNVLTMLALLQFDTNIIVLWNANASRLEQYFQIFLYYSPFYFIIKYIFPEEKIIKQNYDDFSVFLGKWFVLFYVFISFGLFIISIL